MRQRALLNFSSLSLVCGLFGGCATVGSEIPDDPVLGDYALKQRVFELKSGMRVIVQEDHNAPLARVQFRVGAGGTADPPGKEGIAHLVEHLAFRNKPGNGPLELWDIQERMGADRNAYTNQDVTVYFTTVHKDQLPALMQLDAWRLSHTLDGVTDEVLQVEREVVRNELRVRYETTSMNFPHEVFEQLFPNGHDLRRASVIGSHESLQAITLDDVRAFVKKNYTPDNITMIIAGDVEPANIQQELGKWPPELLFGPGGPEGDKVRPRTLWAELPRPPLPPPADTKLRKQVAPVLEPTLIIAWSAPAGGRGDDTDVLLEFAGSMLNRALAQGIDIRPSDDLESFGAFPLAGKQASVFAVFANLKPGADPEAQRTRILNAVAQAWSAADEITVDDQSISQQAQRAATAMEKWFTATDMLRGAAELGTAASEVLDYYAVTGKPSFYKDRLEAISRLETNAIREFVFKYLKRERAISIFLEPEADVAGGTDRPSLVASRNAPAHKLGKSGAVNLAGLDAEAVRRTMLPLNLGKLPRSQLQNGLKIYLVPRKGAPVSEISLQLPGGDATASPRGLARFASQLSYSTCKDHGELTPVGGSLGRMLGSLSTRMSATVLQGNLVNGVAVLGDSVRCRTVHDELLLHMEEPLKEQQKRIDRLRERVQVRATERFWQELYPGHPYGQQNADPKEVAKLSFPVLQSYVKSHYTPDGAVMVAVGDVNPVEFEVMARKYLGTWSRGGGGGNRPPAVTIAPQERKVLLFDRPGATQSNVSIGCRLASVTPETVPGFDLTGDVLTDELSALRESWGSTYGVRAATRRYPDGVAHLEAGGAVETGQSVAALKLMLDLVAQTGQDGPAVKTFTLKRWDAARVFNRRFASGDALAGLILDAELNGWDLAVWDNYPENLANTTRATIRDIVAPCVGKEVVVILGDAKVLKPQLEAAGLAPSETL